MCVSDNEEWIAFAEAKNIDAATDVLLLMRQNEFPFKWKFEFDRKPAIITLLTHKEYKKAALEATKSIRRANYVRKLQSRN